MIVIIGGGICGLSIGWILVKAGQAVTVIERGQIGRGATWAAAGMLTLWTSSTANEMAIFPLRLVAHGLWADFVDELETATGLSLGYRTEGRLAVRLEHEDVEEFRAGYALNQDLGLSLEWLSGDEARQLEPNLAPIVSEAIFIPSGHQVDNRQVVLALGQAFVQAGGILREQTEVLEIVIDKKRVAGVELSEGLLSAETVVLAAGAWSQTIPGLPKTLGLALHPVKGQMLAVQMAAEAPLINHMVTGPASLIPRLDGRLLIGATVAKQAFNTQVTAGAIFGLLHKARQVLPALDRLPLVETWAGLRPGSADDAPLIGPTAVAGLLVATGHYRHGILLAPLTAQAISRLILSGQAMEVIKPFSPSRFAGG